MEFEIGIGKAARRAYGFDEVAIVPSRRTRDPEDVSIEWEIDAYTFPLPMMASAMTEQSSNGHIGHPAASMIENKYGLPKTGRNFIRAPRFQQAGSYRSLYKCGLSRSRKMGFRVFHKLWG